MTDEKDNILSGRVIYNGSASGIVIKSSEPIGFFGHVDPETGIYREAGHPLDGKKITGRVLVFPAAKGSTVYSYVIYGLSKSGMAPVAMLMGECDTITAVGAIIGEIPAVDGIDISRIPNDKMVTIDGGRVEIEES